MCYSENVSYPEMLLSPTVSMYWTCTSVWILTTVTGHGCRGHLVDNRPLMGRGPALHSVSLDRLWNILLCHLPLRACGKNNIRSPILRTQVGLILTKQWELPLWGDTISLELSIPFRQRAFPFHCTGGIVSMCVIKKSVDNKCHIINSLKIASLAWYSSHCPLILKYNVYSRVNTTSFN